MEQELYKKRFEDESFDKMFANNGEEAVALHESWHPNIIILDLMMPVKSGYSALKDIREKEKDGPSQTAVIVISSLTSKEDIMDCVKLVSYQ